MNENEHLLSIGDGNIYAKTWTPDTPPALPPILLLHDSLGCVQTWRNFPSLLALATQRQVVAYDRAGFGQSSAVSGQLTPDFTATEAHTTIPRLLEHFGIQSFVACGHSIGGSMAIETAAHWPARCTAVITMAAQTFVEDKTLDGIRAARENFNNPDIFNRLEKYHRHKARWVLSAWVDTWLSPEFAHWNLADALAQVRCPALVIHGDRDEYGTTQFPDMICARISGPSTKLILRDCGHNPHRERRDEVLSAIAEFLKPA